ncbi:MAG: metallophosphoesterase [Paramuribaculum sp.]|nr:metallophosphoesterase [Paramuribaculum sp.]
MRLPFLGMLFLVLVNVGADAYIYKVLKNRFSTKRPARIQLVTAVVLYILLAVIVCLPRKGGSEDTLLWVMWLLFGYVSVYIVKYLFVIFDLLASVPVIFCRRRIKWLSVLGVFVGTAAFLAMWWGALINRYRIQVNEITVEIADLPDNFDGYTITQFSDLHTGSFRNDTSFISRLVDRINSTDPDLIVFTGDIVNRRSDELLPFTGILSGLEAPDGVVSILGNHDYGDYSTWFDDNAKAGNMQLLYKLQKDMGWQLLLNDYRYIKNGNDSIAIIGVENIGDPPFKSYGSLTSSYPDITDSNVKILLTHNPAHWLDSIAGNSAAKIDLSLSGHTHAMQIEVFGLSPAVFRYKTWGGLYFSPDNKKTLYVNIGSGTVGIPMRLGATPEITVITLKKKTA